MAFANLRPHFDTLFGGGGRIRVVRAPGRVNLIGEHTDYNDGFVLPMAIEPEVRIVCRARTDGMVRLATTAYEGRVEFSLNEAIERSQPQWANYCRGVAAELLAAGIPLVGMDALIASTLPVGSGLSSSAALEVGMAMAFLALAGVSMDVPRLARLCQKAENEYALAPCGLMDQTIVAGARAGHAMLFDVRHGTQRHIPLDNRELRVVIVNSMVKHDLSAGEYGQRRRECVAAVRFFQKENPAITALRDVTIRQIEAARGRLDDTIWRRARHVISENARTAEAADSLAAGDYNRAGELMVRSHGSLRDDYEVSCPELDFLADESMKVDGVHGARMTGGGFGGCVVALVQPRSVDALSAHLLKVYPPQFHCTPAIHVTTATAGANMCIAQTGTEAIV